MKYVYLDKPAYDQETEMLTPYYIIEDGTFVSGWKVDKIPDEDGYVPTPEEQPSSAPSLRQRVDALESTADDIVLLIAELIGGN